MISDRRHEAHWYICTIKNKNSVQIVTKCIFDIQMLLLFLCKNANLNLKQ